MLYLIISSVSLSLHYHIHSLKCQKSFLSYCLNILKLVYKTPKRTSGTTHTNPSLNLGPLVLPRSVSSIPEIFTCRMNGCFVRIIYSGRKKKKGGVGGEDENKKQLAIQLVLSKFQVWNPLFVFILFLFFLPTRGLQFMKRNKSCEIFLEPFHRPWWRPSVSALALFWQPGAGI